MARKKTPPASTPPDDPTPPPDILGGDVAISPLNDREQLFVDEYLIDLDASRAYRTVYPRTPYSIARRMGDHWRNQPHISREIDAARAAQRRRTNITADRVIRELARIAFSDVADIFDTDGNLRPVRNIPIEARRAISGIKVSRQRVISRGRGRPTITEQIIETRFWDKSTALHKLFEHMGLGVELPPLELLLQHLPTSLANQIRAELRGASGRVLPENDGTPETIPGSVDRSSVP